MAKDFSAGTRPRHETTAATHRQSGPQPLAARLVVSGAQATPKELVLSAGSCVVGAGVGCDIVIDDATVSRRHAEFELVPEGVRIRDLGSSNGCFYQGQRVENMVLALGSRVSLGNSTISVHASDDALSQEPSEQLHRYEGLVGSSAAMRRLYAVLTRLEGSLVNVLIHGESGTGKELIAQAIHARSKISSGNFVAVNCGAMAKELVRSELFGHKKGAFTGAGDARAGAFETANDGTLFLDEIGELPLDVQPVLLRVLETGEINRLGDDQTRRVRVRVIAATNVQLEEQVRLGSFREDLYYRLKVIRISVPPLRERPDDIEELIQHFAAELGQPPLEKDVLGQFCDHNWPGNARELRNAVAAYFVIGELPDAAAPSQRALDAALSRLISMTVPYAQQKEWFIERFTKRYLELLLEHTGGNQSEASRVSGIERSYLGKLATRHKVR